MTLTEVVAWVGAVTGALSLLWHVLRWRLEGARLKVRLSWSSRPEEIEFHHVDAVAFNVGRLPVAVHSVGWDLDDGELIHFPAVGHEPVKLPQTLGYEDSIAARLHMDQLIRYDDRDEIRCRGFAETGSGSIVYSQWATIDVRPYREFHG